MSRITKLVSTLALITTWSLLFIPNALAQDYSTCEGDGVSGTIMEVDLEANTATIDMGLGMFCTVSLGGNYTHPIVALFDAYFGEVDGDDLSADLDNLDGWTVYDDASDSWAWADEGDAGAVAIIVDDVVDEGDGTSTIYATNSDGEPIAITTEDASQAESLSDSLDALSVDWDLQTDGDGNVSVVDVGDDVAAYHDDGIGFGDLTKIYAIAEESQEACEAEAAEEETPEESPTDPPATEEPPTEEPPEEEEPCGVTVEELVEAYLDGMSMGDMFALYGKPAMLGVGHIRQALAADGDGSGDGDAGDGVCNARSKGGKAYATGKNVNC